MFSPRLDPQVPSRLAISISIISGIQRSESLAARFPGSQRSDLSHVCYLGVLAFPTHHAHSERRKFVMTKIDHISTLAVAPTGSARHDSITLANGDIWIAYTNGAASTGLSGHSTVVEYDHSGKIDHTYQISG